MSRAPLPSLQSDRASTERSARPVRKVKLAWRYKAYSFQECHASRVELEGGDERRSEVKGDAHPPPRAVSVALFLLHQGHGKNRDGKQNRDERVGIAGKIEVPHGVRPFNTVRRDTRSQSLPRHFSVMVSEVAT